MAFTKQQKKVMGRIVKRAMRLNPCKPVESLRYADRCVYLDFDTCKLYGFIELPEDMSDGEIDDWFEWNMRRRINSPYDCTGQWFTEYIDWHRNPDGVISFVHTMGLDV